MDQVDQGTRQEILSLIFEDKTDIAGPSAIGKLLEISEKTNEIKCDKFELKSSKEKKEYQEKLVKLFKEYKHYIIKDHIER